MPMPNLLDVQLKSFGNLIHGDAVAEDPWDFSLDRVFQEIFPISDVNEKFSFEYVSSRLDEPRYSQEECIERDMTFAAPLKATLRFVVWEDLDDGERRARDIIEKEVYLGDLPLLTDLGTFIVNGAERVVVSQLHRSPGVVFEESIHPNGTKLHSARIIPFRGSWVEFTIDINNICYVHIDKKKFPATALLRALGFGTDEQIYGLFFRKREAVIPAGRSVDDDDHLDDFATQLEGHSDAIQALSGAVLADDVVDVDTGEVILEAGGELEDAAIETLARAGIDRVVVYAAEPGAEGAATGEGPIRAESPIVKRTLAKDPTDSEEAALFQIYSLLRPGEAPNVDTARAALESVFFSPRRYDLGRVGRYKINQRLGIETPASTTVLTRDDFVEILRRLVELSEGHGHTDDIDHLGNRRVRTVGELIANQLSVGLSRMARLVKERMSINTDPAKINIDDLVNARTVSAVIQAFFGSSQLSQFMDQTNPLAEMTHKRRLSALGPGGLTRERAGFEVRDVHYSHYGRMCPIETPEGPNIGLITSLTTYARVNGLGFVETPYRKVVDGRATGEIEWLSANEEERARIAQANAPLNPDGTFCNPLVLCRERGDFPLLTPGDIDYMDVAPAQLVSVAAALIPFLEHDDANRALMGSNMQRQAVPLLYTDAPLVGTGLERKLARDSGAVVTATRGGRIVSVTADKIVIDTGAVKVKEADQPLMRLSQFDTYVLKKYWRTNQDTAINQRPLVQRGQIVGEGEIIADGPSTSHGELALGRNVLVAFMPWYGHNFEDAIVLSEKLVKEDVFTSIHIQELELHVRDTKRGAEEITREIPNVADENLTNLDERGIVRIGAQVKSGDILVGKITPKGETELSPEEKLLTAIFGEKAKDVKDSSLRLSPGMSGTVIDVKIFSRRIDGPLLDKEQGQRIGELRQTEREDIARITEVRNDELKALLHLQTISLCLRRGVIEPLLEEGRKVTKAVLADLDLGEVELDSLKVRNKSINERIRSVVDESRRRIDKVHSDTEEHIDKVFQPDELPPGVVQLVKVYIAEKRKIAVGDKMAGRHGNKGIIARIVPEEEMPFLPDGTRVEIVLNPLGVPSRMNVGQILETHLGWAAWVLGFGAKTPVFQGASEDEVGLLLKMAGVRWGVRALGVGAEPPAATVTCIEQLTSSSRTLPARAEAVGNGDQSSSGLGRSLDDYARVELPDAARAYFDRLRDFLVEAAEEYAERHGRPMEEAFPAIHRLARSESPASGGVDAGVLEFMNAAGLRPDGKAMVRDGRSGRPFDFPVTVGMVYMLKLSHLVDDKIHARSIGPYSLVTQQPLAGKAQFGGQRFGEMEVWALEAYGAAHTLQEILTVKSDDVMGRSRVYEAIVKGENLPEPGIPESFNVLVQELKALGLSVKLDRDD